MEVETSLVIDGGCLREVFRHCSTSAQMKEEVQKIGARPTKIRIKKELIG
jgi:hypothetical protein